MLTKELQNDYKDDWFCKEIMHALSLKGKNIIPILLDGFQMPDQKDLPSEMKSLSMIQSIPYESGNGFEYTYEKYLIKNKYLKSVPTRRVFDEGIADFLFYTNVECDVYERGELVLELNPNNDEDHPLCYPVKRSGEHRFKCYNYYTCEKIDVCQCIEKDQQKYIFVEWEHKQNIWELTEADIRKQSDVEILFSWGKALFNGNKVKPDGNKELSFKCFEKLVDFGVEKAIDYVKNNYKSARKNNNLLYSWCKLASELGVVDADLSLGFMFQYGDNVEKDAKKALEYYNKAKDSGNATAFGALACMYRDGDGVEKNIEKAIELFTLSAEHGEPVAQRLLANLYSEGNGVAQDSEKAIELYKLAAEQGDETAYACLGDLYINGVGVDKDVATAINYYKKGVGSDDANSCRRLAFLYKEGTGVEQDIEKCVELFEKAVEMGDEDSCAYLGNMYRDGDSVEQDYVKAINYYEQGIERGSGYSYQQKALLYKEGTCVGIDIAKAIDMLEKSIELGETSSYVQLGLIYKEVVRDIDKAIDCFTKGTDAGDLYAALSLYFTYSMGERKDISKRFEVANKLYSIDKGEGSSKLSYIYAGGFAGEIDLEKGYEYACSAVESGDLFGIGSVILAQMYAAGLYVQQDMEQAISILSQKEEKRLSIIELGDLYKFTNQNELAINAYKKAVDNEDYDGLIKLGLMYKDGLGVKKSYKKALELFHEAVEKEEYGGYVQIGLMYRDGLGVTQSTDAAAHFFKQAIDNEIYEGYSQFGIMHFLGIGMNLDYKKAYDYFMKALQYDDETEAYNYLGIMYRDGLFVGADLKKAEEYFIKSIVSGSVEAISLYRSLKGFIQHYENYK